MKKRSRLFGRNSNQSSSPAPTVTSKTTYCQGADGIFQIPSLEYRVYGRRPYEQSAVALIYVEHIPLVTAASDPDGIKFFIGDKISFEVQGAWELTRASIAANGFEFITQFFSDTVNGGTVTIRQSTEDGLWNVGKDILIQSGVFQPIIHNWLIANALTTLPEVDRADLVAKIKILLDDL